MKKSLFTLVLCIATSAVFTSCKDKVKEAEITEAEAPAVVDEAENSETYNVVTEESSIEWKGTKPTGEHFGTIAIQEGTVERSSIGRVVSGSVTIDMNSIVVKDIPAEDEGNAKLLGHLKNEDFFDVEKNPTSTFEITELLESEARNVLSGNLTIKGITHNISIPVTVDYADNAVTLTSEAFIIDRTKWDIKYGSKSIFDDLGDKFINDDIELKIVVKAVKA
ncbi:YceI family protein [Tamlana sp. 2_MG-2023]|uniref:YceI family protein n=1 Tax=unclassified Tamlana TaxID=2614803 RepID=UPI0026E46696|nr:MULTISPECIES: YceI family protein [unclassified Tamlana]MDO6759041.1 YceI family protein [Tamlana sp. 2_MG-2023]MDO6789740.1 YceI family protein [Tamlana sp. 1_MG-2023]